PTAPPATFSVQPDGSEMPLAMAHLTVGSEGQVSATPVRLNQAIGDAYLVGLNDIGGLCDCFKVTGVDREPTATGAKVTLELAFDHPFDLSKRPDLFGWDLKAILATDQNAVNFGAAGVVAPADVVANPAGYTKEWTQQITALLPTLSTNTFPYVILGEDRRAITPFDFQNPAGWNVFPAGGTNTGSLELNIPTGATYDFDVFFTVGYHVSATRATRQTPDYQPPRGNSRAPWRVDAAVTSNNLSPAIGTLASIDLSIWDWQHLQSLSSDVTAIKVWEPTLSSLPPTPPIGPGAGSDLDPITSTFNAVNELGTLTGGPDTYVLVEVVDALNGANPGGTGGAPGVLVVGDDFGTITTIDDIRTFQIVPLPVISNLPGVNPVAQVTSTPPMSAGALSISFNTNVLWDGSTSFDPDFPIPVQGDVVGYEWDFEWDGIQANFVDDTAGSGAVTENHLYPTVGSTHLGLRVTDGVGRKSAILDVPITVSALTFGIQWDPILDLPLSVDTFYPSPTEWGASLSELTSNEMAINYSQFQGTSVNQAISHFNGTSWTAATDGFASSGSLEYGWRVKSCPSWFTGQTFAQHSFTNFGSHTPAHEIVFGFNNPMPPSNYCIMVQHAYAFDIACSRVDGSIYGFGDGLYAQPGGPIRCWKGGPNVINQPVFFWYTAGGVTPITIDPRTNHCSRSRSVFTTASGALEIVFTAADGSRVSVARDSNGDNLGWVVTDLATGAAGAYGDPAFDFDEAGGAYIAAPHNTGSAWEIQIFKSVDEGATWGTPLTAGPTIATQPWELACTARTILGNKVICVGYSTGPDTGTSEVRLRWSGTDGSSWTDTLVSANAQCFSPDFLLKRTGTDLYAAWSAPDGSARTNIMARRGVFGYY
ncbi:MAG: hypothetical protein ABI743_09575, partial [bacterium]